MDEVGRLFSLIKEEFIDKKNELHREINYIENKDKDKESS